MQLSATPIRYLDKCRNAAEELFDGNLACDMSLSQAILDGILPMARYVCGVYSYEKDAESLNRKIERSCNSEKEKQELLRELKVLKENLDKGNGVSDIFRKYIMNGNEKLVIFLKNTKHLKIMKPVIEKWFLDAEFKVRMYEVHSKNTDKDREFQAFREDTEDGIVKLCLSVNMLSEGIHGDIDGVIMLRETISANMYFQMIGRAFACGKKTIPLIIDLVANSQFISDAVNLSFPSELRGEIEKRKKECAKEGKEYEVGFNVDEFIVMDEFMDVISGFKAIEGRLEGREWTEEEIEILKKYYPIEGIRVKDKLNGKTKIAIKSKASKLKLEFVTWTDEEIGILKKYYPTERLSVKDRLENKTENAILRKSSELNLKSNRYWTRKEMDILKKYYPKYGNKIKNFFPTRSIRSIQSMAKKMKIHVEKIKKYKYVYKEDNKYIVRFSIDGGTIRFGRFDTEEEAAKVAMEKAKEYGKAI